MTPVDAAARRPLALLAMRPLHELPRRDCLGITAVLLDIDDTLTTDGRLEPEAYGALGHLQAAGLSVIPVTGRPAGWCDMIARFWPVDGVVGENGAFTYRYDHGARRMRRAHAVDEQQRLANRARLDVIAARILAEVPGAALSADQSFRVADLAIDFCEDVPPLPRSDIDRIVAIFEAEGATAKVSSIHVNGWFGAYDKLGMARRFLETELGMTDAQAIERVLFVGDSPNDEPMFAAFPLSVGVANVIAHLDRIRRPPTYVTPSRSGAGFVELTKYLLAARGHGR